MGLYCDSVELENNWFYWLLSSSVPDLEMYRKLGLLWTRVGGTTETVLPDPRNPTRDHCIATAIPFFFSSQDGELSSEITTVKGPHKSPLPCLELDLLSDAWFHDLENPFRQWDIVIPELKEMGYIKEKPTDSTWHLILEDINRMCWGISAKFNQPTEDEQQELANDALLQVVNKLVNYKLVYTPGRAPVFNLLTTTIYRCMYSIMNRRKTQRQGLQRFVSDVQAGMVPKYRNAVKRQRQLAKIY